MTRMPRLRLLLPAAAACALWGAALAADPPAAPQKPEQVSIHLETTRLTPDARLPDRPAVREFLRRRSVDGKAARDLRIVLAALVSSGDAIVADSLRLSTLPGAPPATLQQGPNGTGTGLNASLRARRRDGRLEVHGTLVYRFPNDEGAGDRTVRRRVTVPEGCQVAVRIPEGERDVAAVVFVRVERIRP